MSVEFQKESDPVGSLSLVCQLSSHGTSLSSLCPGKACLKAAMEIKSNRCGSKVERDKQLSTSRPPFPKKEPILKKDAVKIKSL